MTHEGDDGFRGAGTAGQDQSRFEDAVFSVMLDALGSGRRIDLAVADYLDRFPMESGEDNLRPDLIICVADCIGLARRIAKGDAAAGHLVAQAHAAWRTAAHPPNADLDRSTTRVQRCIGNIRRAVTAATSQPQ